MAKHGKETRAIVAQYGTPLMDNLSTGLPIDLAGALSEFHCSLNLLLPTSPFSLPLKQLSALPRGLKALPAQFCSLPPEQCSQTFPFCVFYSGWHLLLQEAQEASENGK